MPSGHYERSRKATYSVYNRRTDMPVMIGGTAKECAAAMGVTLASFWSIWTRIKNGSADSEKKWEIFRDEPEELEG